jgi:ABC-2 type transport system ATP-binding protein
MLEVRHLTKRYTGHTALDDVSLHVRRGTVYGLLGPNGAGKTTLIRIINRITLPDSGQVLLDGAPLTAEAVAHIGYLPEERGLYNKMKVGEQALYFARLKGLSTAEATRRLREWFDRFGIHGWWDKKVEQLSKGMAQKIQFIVTVLHEPKLLIFDEPFSGFDPINANLLKDEILRLKDRGATVIFSTHNMASVEELCDDITLISRSRNILSGPVDAVRRQYGTNLYRVDFQGDRQALAQELAAKGFSVTAEEEAPARGEALRIEIPAGTTVRQAIALLNERVEVHNFMEIVPGMNDIFIKAVNSQLSNQ